MDTFRFTFLVFLPLLLGRSWAQTPAPETLPDATPVRIGEDLYRIGDVEIDRASRTATVHGRVNMQKGLIELFACTPYGKTHESVLTLDVDPIHLQTALLLLGLEYGRNLRYQGDPETPRGDPVLITVEWRLDGEEYSHRAEDLVWDLTNQHSMPHTHWVFTGSRFLGGFFAASSDGTLITTYHDPNTILDNPLESGSNDEVYEVNASVCPPVGTEVTVILKAVDSVPAPESKGSQARDSIPDCTGE